MDILLHGKRSFS